MGGKGDKFIIWINIRKTLEYSYLSLFLFVIKTYIYISLLKIGVAILLLFKLESNGFVASFISINNVILILKLLSTVHWGGKMCSDSLIAWTAFFWWFCRIYNAISLHLPNELHLQGQFLQWMLLLWEWETPKN